MAEENRAPVLIWCNAPPGRQRQYALARTPVRIGRAPDADIVIDEATVSRLHAAVNIAADGLSVELRDLESRFGILVNGQPVTDGSVALGAKFSLGKAVLMATDRSVDSQERPTPPCRVGNRAHSPPQPSSRQGAPRGEPRVATAAPNPRSASEERHSPVRAQEDSPEARAYKEKVFEELQVRLGRVQQLDESPDQLEKRVRQVLDDLLREFSPPSGCSAVAVKKEFCDDVLRYGPIQPLIEDESITEIMVNGPGMIYVERTGRLTETAARFRGNSHLINVIERIVAPLGRRIDESSPMVDARLPDGSRVNAVVPPLAIDGPLLTIRKFRKEGFTVQQLVDNGMFSPAMAVFFRACVSGRLNVLISGGTGSGKTTLLNTLSSFIPPTERIVTIEDSAELRLPQRHVARMEARPANIEGKGRVAIRDLVINALRMRPDRIVVGECRGGEALDMIQAMNTGHDGSLTTAHANTPRDALGRIEVMCLMAGMDLPMRAVREQIASAIQLIVQVQRFRDGSRRIAKVTELMGLQQDVYTLQDLFVYEETGVDKQGRDVGRHRPTGSVPAFREAVEARGEHIPFDLFKTSSPE